MYLYQFPLAFLSFFLLTNSSAQTATDQVDPAAPLAAMKFEATEFEFGTIASGEIVENVFVFQNTSDEPLLIQNAKGSCGCTVPRWPKEPILPGESAELLVRFNSKNKKGKQAKRVTIIANTEPAYTFLTIRGTVGASSITTPLISTSKPIQNLEIEAKDIQIFPNPTTDALFVNLEEFEGQAASIAIYNSQGQQLKHQQVDALSSIPVSFAVHPYPAGTYTVSVKVKDKMRVAKQFMIVRP